MVKIYPRNELSWNLNSFESYIGLVDATVQKTQDEALPRQCIHRNFVEIH